MRSVREIIEKNQNSSICLVTSGVLLRKLAWAIKEIGIPRSNIVLIPDGEKAKEWGELQNMLEKFSKLNLNRKSIIIAFGGGSVGDVTGFAASIYKRGVTFVNIPTTLLAQVDSAHGGKTGINFLQYKNQIGSFYLPAEIIIDKRLLASLSRDQIIDGLGEIIKSGMMKDPDILDLLKKQTVNTLLKSKDLQKIIFKSIDAGNYFINKDFNDNGVRQILNIGHTLGHAIELKYGLSHGKAVIIGMLQEMEIAESLGLAKTEIRKALVDLLVQMGIKLDKNMQADWETIVHDKKITGRSIDFPFVQKIGSAKIIKMDLETFKNNLK